MDASDAGQCLISGCPSEAPVRRPWCNYHWALIPWSLRERLTHHLLPLMGRGLALSHSSRCLLSAANWSIRVRLARAEGGREVRRGTPDHR
jgi:hypothetical protein